VIRQLPLPLAFNPEHDFEEYYPGGNAEAVGHLRNAARGEGEPFIYLWGEAGLGKTHLLHACCREAHRAGLTVSYVPLRAVREYGGNVLDGLEEQDLVCLDDLETVAGDESWEQALFDLFNRLRDERHGFIISARTLPGELPVVLPDLKTRFSWGLTLLLRDFSDADKIAALSLRARLRGLELPPAVGRFLLSNCRRDLPGLMELLEQLDRATLAAKRKLTIPFIKNFLAENP
jgi:DnaA family protein